MNSFDPCEDKDWNIPEDIEEYKSSLFSNMQNIAFEKWDLNDRECNEIAHAVTNALWAGYTEGLKRNIIQK
jgi:hypothetical protein